MKWTMKRKPRRQVRKVRWYFKEWREHRGLSGEELAYRIGTTKGQISKLETGMQRANDTWIALYADALVLHDSDLLRDPRVPATIYQLLDEAEASQQGVAAEIIREYLARKSKTD